MIFRKIMAYLLLASSIASAMEKAPEKISVGQRGTVKRFLEAIKKNDFDFFKKRSVYALENIIPLTYQFLEDQNELESLRKELKITKTELIKNLNGVIKNAQEALSLSPDRTTAPGQNPPVLLPAPANKVFHEDKLDLQVEFSNQTPDKIVTAWIASGPNDTWEGVKILPFKDSKSFNPAEHAAIHLYVGSEGFLLLPMPGEKTLTLAKEILTDKYMGRTVEQYATTQEIKRIKLKSPAKVIVIFNPDSSITLAEKV